MSDLLVEYRCGVSRPPVRDESCTAQCHGLRLGELGLIPPPRLQATHGGKPICRGIFKERKAIKGSRYLEKAWQAPIMAILVSLQHYGLVGA